VAADTLPMNLSIIIVNWNSRDYLRRCLDSLRRHSPGTDREVIVVDGGSFDGCDRMLAEEFPEVRFIQSPDNVGFARANNLGFRHASGRHILFLNPDTEFHEDSPRILCERLDRLPGAGAVGCRLLNRDGTLQGSCVQSFPTPVNQMLDSEYLRSCFPRSRLWGTAALHAGGRDPAEVEAVSGACLLARRAGLERVGGFSEGYFMYGEDLDLCFKLRRAGEKVYYVPETSVTHFGGGSSASAAADFSTIMMRESVFRFMRWNRGEMAAWGYRLGMLASALIRLIFIGPLLLFGRRVVRHGRGSLGKWYAVLRWSVGAWHAT
jgi:GT2 family glycosyltransferase